MNRKFTKRILNSSLIYKLTHFNKCRDYKPTMSGVSDSCRLDLAVGLFDLLRSQQHRDTDARRRNVTERASCIEHNAMQCRLSMCMCNRACLIPPLAIVLQSCRPRVTYSCYTMKQLC